MTAMFSLDSSKTRATPSLRRIFISASQREAPMARRLEEALKNQYEVVTGSDIPHGQDLRQAIASRIKDCQIVVALLTREPSNWVSWELAMATALSKPVILLTRESADPTKLSPLHEFRILRYSDNEIGQVANRVASELAEIADQE